jgi:pimeloyl-ACP methyl ester carboxylesterase
VAVQDILAHLNDDTYPDRNLLLADLGALLARADAYDAATSEDAGFHCQYDVFRGVWDEAARLRKEGVILRLGEKIHCPVIAIHGDTDPHPAAGVNDPLSRVLPSFRFIHLDKCGHRPWTERYAAEEFFRVLAHEI